MDPTFPKDGSIRLSRLIDDVQEQNLGPAFIEALYNVIMGLPYASGATATEIWAISTCSTAQRIQAAERVLQEHDLASN